MAQEIRITTDTELHLRIMHLNALKEEQELIIKRNIREIGYSLHPAAMLKNAIGKLTEDQELTDDLKTAGLMLGKDFLLQKLFGKGQSLKGFLGSLILRKVTDYIVNKHPDLITNGIGKLENFISNHLRKPETVDE
jgi:hypothetical protein